MPLRCIAQASAARSFDDRVEAAQQGRPLGVLAAETGLLLASLVRSDGAEADGACCDHALLFNACEV